MKQLFLLVIFTLSSITFSFGQQNSQQKMEDDIKQLEQSFTDFFKEFGEQFEEGQTFLKEHRIEKHGDNGQMIIGEDTLNISTLPDAALKYYKLIPEPYGPSPEKLEQLKQTQKILPELLLQGKDMMLNMDLDALLEQLKDMKMDIPQNIKPSPPSVKPKNGESKPKVYPKSNRKRNIIDT